MTTSPRRCPLCLQTHTDSALEHVFPEAVGGAFTIDTICTACNHWLGSNIDSYLTDHWLIQVRRRALGLVGKKGQLPRPRLVGTLDEFPEIKAILGYDNKGEMTVRIEPQVLMASNPDGTVSKKVVVGDAERSTIPTIINKIRSRSGQELLSPDEIASQYQVHSVQQPRVTGSPEIDIHDYRRALIKIAYELSHRWLGDAYLEDPVAKRLRDILRSSCFSPEDFQNSDLKGQIFLGNDLLPTLPLDSTSAHVAYIKQMGNLVVLCVHIFEFFQACLVVSDNAEQYGKIPEVMILVDAKNKTYTESPLEEVIASVLRRARESGHG